MKVKTKNGIFIGVEEKETIVFKGIPYAKPPVGNLRYKAPEKLDPSAEEYNADKFSSRSLQCVWEGSDGFYENEFPLVGELNTPPAEDSLYLNIWVPKERTEEKMPVLFYIHGGGFGGGTGHEIEFHTDEYAKRGIIVVTINYRLGMTGFLVHPWLIEEDPVSVGNYGVLDQIMALDWVIENISNFGGDSGKITICGQSAGAMSVYTIMASRYGDGKYSGAIMQSGSGYPQLLATNLSMEEAIEFGEKYVQLLGATSLEELRKCPAEKLAKAQMELVHYCFTNGKTVPFGPIKNGYFLKDTITESVEKGHIYPVPTIIGCNSEDLLTSPEDDCCTENIMYRSNIAYSLMNEMTNNNPTYVYLFKRKLPGDNAGAFHSAELWYTMGSIKHCWRPMTEDDYELKDRMVEYWSNFIKTGNPASETTKPWGKCRRVDPFVKVFDVN